MTIRIVVVDDHPLLRQGVCAMLASQADMEVVGEAGNGREAVEQVRACQPDVVLMDIQMPELNGMLATRQILETAPETRVIALSSYSDRRFVNETLRAGASGYILKDQVGPVLPEAIRTVCAGETYLSPAIQSQIVAAYKENVPAESTSQAAVLSEREREILQLIAEGKESKEIAALLHVSRKTVDTHRRHIMEKLELYSVAELTRFAIREGLTPLE